MMTPGRTSKVAAARMDAEYGYDDDEDVEALMGKLDAAFENDDDEDYEIGRAHV